VITAWRLVMAKFAEHVFDGQGARLYGGRWNSPGKPVVYCSATASLAALEVLANLQRSELLSAYALASCSFDSKLVTAVDDHDLPANWRQSPAPLALAAIGDTWIRTGRSAVLAVPSAVIDREKNYLLNPRHPDFPRVTLGEPKPFAFDLRLVGTRNEEHGTRNTEHGTRIRAR
jgi:RES domain-containing protein